MCPDVGAHIFLSYSRGDRPYVSELAAFLADAGVYVWWDDDDPGGDRDGSVSRGAITASAGVVVVLTPGSMASDRVQDEIKHASDVHKPILALRLEPNPPQDIGIGTAHQQHVAHLHHEDVSGGRMPGPALVARLLALTREAAAGPSETVPSPTATAELIATYLPTVNPARLSPSRRLPSLAALPWSGTRSAHPESIATPRRRIGVVTNGIVTTVAALGLVWLLVNQLPDVAGGSPEPQSTSARTPTAAVIAFISAAEVRDDGAVRNLVCQRYRDVRWYAADFNTSNFIQAKLVLITAADDSATVSIEMNFHVDGETVVKGRQYSVVHEGGGWKVCGPA